MVSPQRLLMWCETLTEDALLVPSSHLLEKRGVFAISLVLVAHARNPHMRRKIACFDPRVEHAVRNAASMTNEALIASLNERR